jgi:hypothetical protein
MWFAGPQVGGLVHDDGNERFYGWTNGAKTAWGKDGVDQRLRLSVG